MRKWNAFARYTFGITLAYYLIYVVLLTVRSSWGCFWLMCDKAMIIDNDVVASQASNYQQSSLSNVSFVHGSQSHRIDRLHKSFWSLQPLSRVVLKS